MVNLFENTLKKFILHETFIIHRETVLHLPIPTLQHFTVLLFSGLKCELSDFPQIIS